MPDNENFLQLERRQNEVKARIAATQAQLSVLMRRRNETEAASTSSVDLDLQNRQSQLDLDQELYEKVSRRLQEMQMEQHRSPRVQIAAPAAVRRRLGDDR